MLLIVLPVLAVLLAMPVLLIFLRFVFFLIFLISVYFVVLWIVLLYLIILFLFAVEIMSPAPFGVFGSHTQIHTPTHTLSHPPTHPHIHAPRFTHTHTHTRSRIFSPCSLPPLSFLPRILHPLRELNLCLQPTPYQPSHDDCPHRGLGRSRARYILRAGNSKGGVSL